jgi:hypothetical protein
MRAAKLFYTADYENTAENTKNRDRRINPESKIRSSTSFRGRRAAK